MNKYIALLRGINVSGHKKIKMIDLRLLLENNNLKSVQTYIQSGNIIFESEVENQYELEVKIHKLIQEKYGFEVPVLVKNKVEWNTVFQNNPYFNPDIDLKMLHVTLLSDIPSNENINKLKSYDYGRDKFLNY